MKAVIQITQRAALFCNQKTISDCKKGMLVLLGFCTEDTEREALLLIDRILKLRVFADDDGKLNLSSLKIGADILVVSNFTLYADCTRSRRPDFLRSMRYDDAEKLYRYFLTEMEKKATELCEEGDICPRIFPGVFGGDMKIELVNDGPVTLVLDTDDFK